ncbi:hypothetical protein AAIB41_11335 [Brucella sp. BE17]|uniref:hypothetical protein n=1 Tax=Brucella sp. BE17 TaxID=3142977 RepID=UPI0031BB2055
MGVKSSNTQRGTILVSVLWIMIFLGFLAVILRVQLTGVVASVRVTEDKASARILAEAGLSLAVAEIRAGPPDGVDRLSDQISSTITLPAGVASVSATNEALRIDLNTAEQPLIIGALRAAGAAPAAADDLARGIIARRSGATNGQPVGPTSPQPVGNKKLFQTVSELAVFPGITPNIAIAIDRYLTVSSGLSGVRLEALDDRLLGAIPSLSPSVRKAISDFDAGRLSREQLNHALAGVNFNTPAQAQSWRVVLRTNLQSGYSESFEALILVSAADKVAYRVLEWRRTATELE